MRSLRTPQPEILTRATTFEKGKERRIVVRLAPEAIYLRCQGLSQWHAIPYPIALLHGAAATAGFDPSPAKRRRVCVR